MPPGLPPDLARRFRSGRPCLDLVHTGGAQEHAVWEIVHTTEDLEWVLPVLLRTPGTRFRASPQDVPRLRGLRAAVTRAAFAVAGGDAPDPADVAAINAAAAHPPLVPELHGDGVRIVEPTVRQALASLARDAVELLGGPLRERVRVCAAADCALLYVDTSRSGTRRWCSMQRCGTLAKVRTHRARAAGDHAREER